MNRSHPDRRTLLAGGLALLVALALPMVSAPTRDALETGFATPPAEAKVRCYWWWLNGNTNEATITRDLEAMKAKGYGGALLVDADGSSQEGNRPAPAGPTFASPAWRVLYRHALAEANRLGLEISLNIVSGWNLGGPMVKPEQGAKLLAWSHITVQGPAEIQRVLPQPAAPTGFYRDIAVLAYPLHHGAASPGDRQPIRQLDIKAASRELGMSTPRTWPLLEDVPAIPGEEDAASAEVRDVSAGMDAGGQFTWNVPAGSWEILRMGYTASGAKVSTSSGAWQGLAIDYMDHTALDTYWQQVVAPLMDDAMPYLGKSLRYLVTDSWELGGVNWTARFRQEFQLRRGYDLLPYLPVVAGRIVGSREASNRFLNDFRRTVGDLIISEHYQPFAKLAAGFGLGIHPESGGPHGAPLDALETLGASAFPQTEFWAPSATHRTTDGERFFVKQASSAAHIYGKVLVGAEGMTSIGPQWQESPGDDLKPAFDQAVSEGLNRLIWHTFTSSPKEMGLPGQEYFAGTHLNPNVTWWNQAGPMMSYFNRSQFLLQQGQPVVDVVYYYGDQVPNFVQLKSSDPAKVLPGYDYDVTDENVLVHRMAARGGRILLPEGMSYRLLVLPEVSNISAAAAGAIRKLVSEGATVLGSKPLRATGMNGDAEVRAIAAEVWGDCGQGGVKQRRFGKGTVYCGQSTREVLKSLGVAPDVEGEQLDYFHRRTDTADIYFLRNTQAQAIAADVTLRTSGKSPELWHADSGQVSPQAVYDVTVDGRVKLPLRLEPFGSTFVVLRHAVGRHFAATTADAGMQLRDDGSAELETAIAGRHSATLSNGQTLSGVAAAFAEAPRLEGPWTIAFPANWGAPAQITIPQLESWTANADEGVRHFSGTARYTQRFFVPGSRLDSSQRWYLDLGEVREIAEVKVNGQDLGILWKRPYRVALGAAVRPGWNQLEVAVTNLWPNRLIGDQSLPSERRLTRTNITKFTADSPLLPSGLLGPVKLETTQVLRLVAR